MQRLHNYALLGVTDPAALGGKEITSSGSAASSLSHRNKLHYYLGVLFDLGSQWLRQGLQE